MQHTKCPSCAHDSPTLCVTHSGQDMNTDGTDHSKATLTKRVAANKSELHTCGGPSAALLPAAHETQQRPRGLPLLLLLLLLLGSNALLAHLLVALAAAEEAEAQCQQQGYDDATHHTCRWTIIIKELIVTHDTRP